MTPGKVVKEKSTIYFPSVDSGRLGVGFGVGVGFCFTIFSMAIPIFCGLCCMFHRIKELLAVRASFPRGGHSCRGRWAGSSASYLALH